MHCRTFEHRASVRLLAAGAACLLSSGAACWEAAQIDPDVGEKAPPLSTSFIAPGVTRDVMLGSQKWRLDAREALVTVGDSVDLWLVDAADPRRALFVGAAPSCYGRDRTRPDPDNPKRRISACYLALFRVENDTISLRAYLGGGWAHSLELPLRPVVSDTDADGWSDAFEMMLGSDPARADSDGDGTPDSQDRLPLSVPPRPVVAARGKAPPPPQPSISNVVNSVVSELAGCHPNRPFLVLGPREAASALPERECVQVFLDAESPAARARARILPLDGRTPKGFHVMEEAAYTGGISRAYVEVTSIYRNQARVVVTQVAGQTKRLMEWNGTGWDTVEKDFKPAQR